MLYSIPLASSTYHQQPGALMTPTTAPDYQSLHAECVRHLQALIRLDTSNPPGNEILAARYIQEQLAQVGVDSEIVESAPGRANLRSILKGDGSERPLLLMSHTDVVPVEPEYWFRARFSGEIEGGSVWGRGAVDMQQWVAWHLTIFLDLVRRDITPRRDIGLLATADEEDGSYMGMRWVAANLPNWLDAEYGLSEGGGGEMRVGGRSFFTCRVAEKGACRFHLRAHGSPGHASRPHRDNALVKLGGALHRLGTTSLPLQASDTVRGTLQELLGDSAEASGLIARLLQHETFEDALREAPFSDTVKLAINAQLHNTAAPTILHPAGARINVIPSVAEASVDGRTLPNVTAESFADEVRAVVGSDVEV